MRSIIIAVMMKSIFPTAKRNARAEHPSKGARAAGFGHVAMVLGAALACAALGATAGEEEPTLSLKIRNHQFYPAELEIPAGEKRMLIIENQDATVEEFESHSLHREKIVPPLSKTNLYIGPLKPGRYEFIGEYNDATAKGVVVAK